MTPPEQWSPTTRKRSDGEPYLENVWHSTLMRAYSAAAWDWWSRCEAAAIGHRTEEAEFAAAYPRPTLKRFMLALSLDWREPT